jgi:hypothetical protein
MYKASQSLIDILKLNGFRDKSYLYTSEYGRRFLSSTTDYDPGKHKKVFGLGYGKRRLEIYFDYINIAVTEQGNFLTDHYIQLSESQLRSIITFFKCSYARQKTLKKYCEYKVECAGNLMLLQREAKTCEPPFDKDFENLFNSVLLG